MKTIQISETGGPEVMEYIDVEPPTPRAGQVVVKTESISVNYADLMIREGKYPVMPSLPTVLGLEASGVVVDVGEGVAEFNTGQRVCFIAQGCYSEKVAVDSSALIPMPDEIDFDSAAAFPVTYLTAYHLLHTLGKAKRGEWILLYATVGGVGIAVTQLAKIAGLKIIGLTSSEQKASRAIELGVDYVFTYDHANLVEDVVDITDGKGVDLVLESVAGQAFPRNFDMLAPLGQVLWFGMSDGLPPAELFDSFGKHFVRGVGLRTFHLTHSIADPYPEMLSDSITMVVRYLQEKKVKPVIHDRIPLQEAVRAHELLQSRRTVGKLILMP